MPPKAKVKQPDDFIQMAVRNMKYKDYHDFLVSTKESGMHRAEYLKLCYDTAHEAFNIITDKNKMLQELADLNVECNRTIRKIAFVLKHKFNLVLPEKESGLDELIKQIEEPFE